MNSRGIQIDVDVTNPGQYFACCGLHELADRLWDGAEAWFGAREFIIRPAGTGWSNHSTLPSLR